MQLFAIVGGSAADNEKAKRFQRSNVALFLRHQIASSQVSVYLSIYDDYFSEHAERLLKSRNSPKSRSRTSVRIILICEGINKELELEQKFVVLARLIEFARLSGDGIDSQQLEFITGVADAFHIEREELAELLYFASKDHFLPAQECRTAQVVHIVAPAVDASPFEDHIVLRRRHLG